MSATLVATEVEATEAVRVLDLIETFPTESVLAKGLLLILKETYAGNDITITEGVPR